MNKKNNLFQLIPPFKTNLIPTENWFIVDKENGKSLIDIIGSFYK